MWDFTYSSKSENHNESDADTIREKISVLQAAYMAKSPAREYPASARYEGFASVESQTSGIILSVKSERYESASPENPPSFLYNAGLS